MLLEKLNSDSPKSISIKTYGEFVYHKSTGVRIWTEHYARVLEARILNGEFLVPNSRRSYSEFLEEQKKTQ